MKIFIALVLIVITVIGLVRGTIFKDRIVKMKQNAGDYLKVQINEIEYTKKQLVLIAPMTLFVGMISLLELIFYFSVVGIPALTIPTIFMMLFFIIQVVKIINKNKENKVEKTGDPEVDLVNRAIANANVVDDFKIRTTYGTFVKVMYLGYFVLALLILI